MQIYNTWISVIRLAFSIISCIKLIIGTLSVRIDIDTQLDVDIFMVKNGLIEPVYVHGDAIVFIGEGIVDWA